LYQKGAYYSSIKVFNNLPPNIRNVFCDAKRFESELGKYLQLKSFYAMKNITTAANYKLMERILLNLCLILTVYNAY